jgi:serine/threonine-protein kinase
VSFEPASLVGTTLDDRYVLTAHIATGGMGAIFRARHVHLRKDVAVKVLRPDLTGSAEIVERFRREAEIASALEHDNIVRVTDFGRSSGGYLFLVMELLTGESLFDRLRREGFLPPEHAVPILWQVCAGLEAAHALGVVHRDLKPENVYLARTSSGREVTKLLDFGIAKIADPASGSATQSGIVVGTPEYLSPEQAMGAAIDARADVYAVGLIAWRALAGRHPFKAEDPRSLLMMQATRPVPPLTESRPDLTSWPGLVAAIAKACAKEPDARHQTAAALREDLAAALGPSFMMPPGATPAPSPSLRALSPVPPPARRVGDLAFAAGATGPASFPLPASSSLANAMQRVRLRIAAVRLGRRALERVARIGGAAKRGAALVRARPFLSIAAVLAVAVAVASAVAALWYWENDRAAGRARELIAANRASDARSILDAALEHSPSDPELLLLRGHALHLIPGRAGDGVEAYAAAREGGPLDPTALDDLAADLGRERSLADKASRVLREEGAGAIPVVLRTAQQAPGVQRLRALALARDLGAEEDVDRADAYGGLLGDADCDVRRAAARRLGEIGDTAALPALRKAAQARIETRGFFGHVVRTPVCGAQDAQAAVRRIEAARLP